MDPEARRTLSARAVRKISANYTWRHTGFAIARALRGLQNPWPRPADRVLSPRPPTRGPDPRLAWLKRATQRTTLAMLTPKRLAAALRDMPPSTTAPTTRSRRSSESAIPAASFARRQPSSRSKPIRESLPRFNSLGDRSKDARSKVSVLKVTRMSASIYNYRARLARERIKGRAMWPRRPSDPLSLGGAASKRMFPTIMAAPASASTRADR